LISISSIATAPRGAFSAIGGRSFINSYNVGVCDWLEQCARVDLSGSLEATVDKTVTILFDYVGLRKGDLIPVLLCAALIYLAVPPILTQNFPALSAQYEGNALLVALLSGYFMFLIYRRVIGEFFLFPLQQELCWAFDWLLSKLGAEPGGDFFILHKRGVRAAHLRDAYNEIRNEFLKEGDGEKLRVQHGEVHVLYVIAVFFATAYLLMLVSQPESILLWICLASFVVAFVVDSKQHAVAALRFRDDDDVFDRLRQMRPALFRTTLLDTIAFVVGFVCKSAALAVLVVWLFWPGALSDLLS
jgi:hypothetical protein